MTKRLPYLRGFRKNLFIKISRSLVPRASTLTFYQQEESIHLVNLILADKPSSKLFQLSLLLFLLQYLPLLIYLVPFTSLSSSQQNKFLNFLFAGPAPLIRKGFWGLNTLAKLGVYGQAAIGLEMGYRLKEIPA